MIHFAWSGFNTDSFNLTSTFSMALPSSSCAAIKILYTRWTYFLETPLRLTGLSNLMAGINLSYSTLTSLVLFSWIFLITGSVIWPEKHQWWEKLASHLVAEDFDVPSPRTESPFYPTTSNIHVYCWSTFHLRLAKKNQGISLEEGSFQSFPCKCFVWEETCCHMLCQM